MTRQVVETGLATWNDQEECGGTLFLRGQGRLLSDIRELKSLTTIQLLFDRLEAQDIILRLLDLIQESDGVRIFIGAESDLFGVSGMSMVVAPTRTHEKKIVGAIGVIGPTRLNYGRIVPVVDYTARVIGEILS